METYHVSIRPLKKTKPCQRLLGNLLSKPGRPPRGLLGECQFEGLSGVVFWDCECGFRDLRIRLEGWETICPSIRGGVGMETWKPCWMEYCAMN